MVSIDWKESGKTQVAVSNDQVSRKKEEKKKEKGIKTILVPFTLHLIFPWLTFTVVPEKKKKKLEYPKKKREREHKATNLKKKNNVTTQEGELQA